MAQQIIGIGSAVNDGTGDPARTAFQKANANFTELYGLTLPVALMSLLGGGGVALAAPASGPAMQISALTGTAGLAVSAAGGTIEINGGSGNNLVQAATSNFGVALGLWAGGSSRIVSAGGLSIRLGATLASGAVPTGGTDYVTISSGGNTVLATPASGVSLTVTAAPGNPGISVTAGAASGAIQIANNNYYQGATSTGVTRMLGISGVDIGYVGSIDRALTGGLNIVNGSSTPIISLTSTGTVTIPAPSAGNAVTISAGLNASALVLNQNGTTSAMSITGGTNPTITLTDGTDFVKVQQVTGTGAVFGSGSTATAIISANVARISIDATGNVVVGSNTTAASLFMVNGGYITAGTNSAPTGPKILAGIYSNGNITTLGSEYSSGGPVLGSGVWPSTAASNSFISATGVAVARGSYAISSNQHIWSIGASQTVAIGSAVTMTEAMRINSNGGLVLAAPTAGTNITVTPIGSNLAFNSAAPSGVASTIRLGQSGVVNWDLQNVATTGEFRVTNGTVQLISSAGNGFLNINSGNGQVSLAAPTSGTHTISGVVKLTPVTVASLPTAASAGSGAKAFVSDATATTFASAVTGGGSNPVPVYSDGTTWRIG